MKRYRCPICRLESAAKFCARIRCHGSPYDMSARPVRCIEIKTAT